MKTLYAVTMSDGLLLATCDDILVATAIAKCLGQIGKCDIIVQAVAVMEDGTPVNLNARAAN